MQYSHDVVRLSLQQYVRQVGKRLTTPEKLEIAQRRGKLSTRISAYQHRARQWLQLTEEEEDDESYSYEDTHLFLETDDGEICLAPVDQMERNAPDATGVLERPEHFRLALPSTLGMPICRMRHLQNAVEAECELRVGQANDALQGVRLAIARKAFVFRHQVRHAVNKKHKTRAYTKIQLTDTSLRYHAQLYRQSRGALKQLNAGPDLLKRFQELKPEHLKTTTTFIDYRTPGMKHKTLAWFWHLDVQGDSIDDSLMLECEWINAFLALFVVDSIPVYRVNWLRAREIYKRTREEVILVSHEMEWTVRYFRHEADRWSKRKTAVDTPGHIAVALRMESMWMRFATRSMEVFNASRQKYPPPLEECSPLSL